MLFKTVREDIISLFEILFNLLFFSLEFGINGYFPIHHRFLCRIFHVFFDDQLMVIELIQNIQKYFSIENEELACKFHFFILMKNRRTFFFFISRNPFPPLSNIDILRKEKYDASLIQLINSATLLKSLEKCDTVNTNMHNLIRNQNR